MNTTIDTTQIEFTDTNTAVVEAPKAFSLREHILTWLIVVASVVAAIQVFRTVALQLEVNHALDELYELAGQPQLPKS